MDSATFVVCLLNRLGCTTTEFFVFQQSFLLNTTFRPGNLGLLPGQNVVFNKNDCWKTKNSVVECKARENACEKSWRMSVKRVGERL